MKFFRIAVCCFAVFSFYRIHAQVPVVEWQKCLGGNNGEYTYSIEPTSDGGYIVGAYTEGPDNGDITGYHGNFNINDILIFKLDARGNIQWQKCLGGTYFETGAFIHQTADGGYILAGSSASVDCNIKSHNSLDYWVVKLSSDGTIQWQKSYGGSKNEYALGISLLNDGGYIVTGHSESNDGDVTGNHGGRDFWVIKIDGSGTLVWQKSMGGSADDASSAVEATADGGCIVTGTTESVNGDVVGNHGTRDYWVVKLSAAGNIQWQKCYGGSYFDEPNSIRLTKDGGYIVAGYTSSNDGDVTGNHWSLAPHFSDYWVVKLDVNGNIQWQKCYGGKYNDMAYTIQLTPDGGYVISGSAESPDGDATCNAGDKDIWIIKINASGSLEWQKSLGGSYVDEGLYIQNTADGGFIIGGHTCSLNVSGYHPSTNMGSCADVWIIKLTPPLVTPPAPAVTISPANGTVCPGGAAVFTASVLYGGTNTDYQWKVNGLPAGTNSSSLNAVGLSTGDKINCTVTAGATCETAGSQVSNTITVTIDNNIIQPSISISADATAICDCTPVIFQATVLHAGASPHYDWKINNISTGINRSVFTSNQFRDGDVISCVYTDNATCVANGSVTSNTITLKTAGTAPPVVSIATADAGACSGAPVTFTASCQNAGTNPVYQWKINNTNAGTNSSVFISSALSNHDMISCSVTVDPLFQCAQAATASSNAIDVTITNKLNPALTIAASATKICQGIAITFTAVGENTGNLPSYQWKINGIDAGSGTNRFTTSSVRDGDIISCVVTVDPSYACALSTTAASNAINITVTAGVIPSVSITASAEEVCAGDPLQFDAVAANAGTSPSYTWKVNSAVTGSNTPVYRTRSLQTGDQISCEVMAGTGTCAGAGASSNTIVAVINDLPVVTVRPADTSIYTGQQVLLKGTVTPNAIAYQWTPPDKLSNDQTLSPSSIPLTDNVTYLLVAETVKGCRATATSVVKVFRQLYMPNAFTPNRDQKNDLFRIPANVPLLLKEFDVFNRWGKKVFSTNDIRSGWDGNVNGRPADADMYVYIIKGSDDKGAVLLKGTFILVR